MLCCLRLHLLGRLLARLNVWCVLLYPLGARVGKISAANSREDDGDKVRWDTALHRLPQHGLFHLALFKSQRLLSCLLLFLLASFLFCLGRQPVFHPILGTLPLWRCWR